AWASERTRPVRVGLVPRAAEERGHAHPPRLDDELTRLHRVEPVQPGADPVEPEVALRGHQEGLRVAGDQALALLLGEAEPDDLLVLGEGEEDDRADPELPPPADEHLVGPLQAQREPPDVLQLGHPGFSSAGPSAPTHGATSRRHRTQATAGGRRTGGRHTVPGTPPAAPRGVARSATARCRRPGTGRTAHRGGTATPPRPSDPGRPRRRTRGPSGHAGPPTGRPPPPTRRSRPPRERDAPGAPASATRWSPGS